MRLSSALTVAALAASPIGVCAAGTLGFAIGFNNADGSCKSQQDYEDDFDALKSVTTIVRTYSSSSCNGASTILPAAVAKGFKVILGMWPDTDDAYNKDKAAVLGALKDKKNAAAVYAVTCGSEALYRKSLKPNELLDKINDVKKSLKDAGYDIKVGFADSWNRFADGTADPLIQGGVTFLMANGFSFWQAQTIKNASHSYLDDMFQAITHIQNTAGTTDIEVWNGETGWPTDGGTNYPPSIAGTDNAKTFYKTGVCAALRWGLNVFYFEAFDEPAKPQATGTNGGIVDETHWGAFTADRKPKFSLDC